MTQATAMPVFRYRALISYSHQDTSWACGLHETLETLAIPPRPVDQITAAGMIPRRFASIFRNRHELASATAPGRKVNEAPEQAAILASTRARRVLREEVGNDRPPAMDPEVVA
ncbi:MAG TPA: hypothetical protein VIM06_04520 [Rhodanobacter sp.]